ncbi:hypothetical protein PIB30_026554 [Stylosanthes scabra]|uniref:FAD-binding PCMH-type domain-containing protein n=1 Tax=Stylosanthes scabra TaxID=79078 RepID=A0ABU6SAH7_9FABA|nr:hypothetical protein [Stylosanthes scabra]
MATSSSLPFLFLSTLLAATIAVLLQSPVSHANPEMFFQACLSHAPVSVTEALYTPDNSSFSDILNLHIHNKRFNRPTTPKPVTIITALNESHVQAAVTCAKASHLQLRIRSGGHDYEGFSFVSDVPFVLLDMYNLNSIDVDIQNGVALVEAGATLGQLYYKVAKTSPVHAVAAGVCTNLGTGGHFSGGGYGNLMRKYGLSVDNIIDAKIVDANGRILDRKSMGEDLFWAIRGGGGASFGVILSWTIKLVEVPPLVTVFKVNRTLEQGATDIVYKWQHVAPNLDRDLFIRLQLQVHHNTVQVSFIGEFLGRIDRLLNLMKECFPELGLQQSDCFELPWVNSTLFFADYPIGTPAEQLLFQAKNPAQIYFKSKSDYVKNVISKQGLESIWKKFIESEVIVMQWNPYGGIMWEIPASATPFPHRAGNLFKIQYYQTWVQDGEDATNRNLNVSRSMHDFMSPFVSKAPREAFLNYRDRDIGAAPSIGPASVEAGRIYGLQYFRENFDRLVQVKTRVDPNNFFRYEQMFSPVLILTWILFISILRLAAIQNSHNDQENRASSNGEKQSPTTAIEIEPSKTESMEQVQKWIISEMGFESSSCFVEWNVKAPLEVIYEEGEEQEAENGNIIGVIQRDPSLSRFYPELDSDSSSSEIWLEDEEEREGLIEIALDDGCKKKDKKREMEFHFDEENLIEIDISPMRYRELSGEGEVFTGEISCH